MNIDESNEFIKRFYGTNCPCGGKKTPAHWVCAECWEWLHNTKEWRTFKISCIKHQRAYKSVLDMIGDKKK